MAKIKIYFYSTSTLMKRNKGVESLYMATSPLYLDSYVKQFDPELYDNIEWVKIQLAKKTQQQLIDEINQSQADIVCVGLYLWNSADILACLKGIKQHLHKPVTIVAGGPSVDIYTNRSWLHENPDVDFAVYTQGEVPFLSILHQLTGKKKITVLNTKNLAWLSQGKLKLADFEFLRRKGSHYLESSHLLQQMAADPEYKNIDMFEIPYETGRGCAYACSFCDWTAGLTHKVSHRNSDWHQEFKLFGECRAFIIHLSDANAGQVEQDVGIFQAMIDVKKDLGYPFQIYNANFSKLKKQRSFKIMDMLMEAGILKWPKFAVQDIDATVLKNIGRPDIPWPDHKQLILNLKQKRPQHPYFVEIIIGLPGQTRATIKNTLMEIVPNFKLTPYKFTLLPNSPAGTKEYQKRMKLKIVKTNIWALGHSKQDTNRIEVNNDYDSTIYDAIVGSYSYTVADYMYFHFLLSALGRTGIDQKNDMQKLFEAIDNCKDLETMLTGVAQLLLDSKCQDVEMVFLSFLDTVCKTQYNILGHDFVKNYVRQVRHHQQVFKGRKHE